MDLTFAYFAPETLLPATSIIATALGFIMLVGRGSYRLALRALRVSSSPSNAVADTSTPHFNDFPPSHDQSQLASTPTMSATVTD
jgi:hypothetical protein